MSLKTNKKMLPRLLRRGFLSIAVIAFALPAAAQALIFSPGSYTVDEAFREVSSNTGYRFAVNARFDRNRPVFFMQAPATVEEMLGVVLRDTDYRYVIDGKYIMIKADPDKAPAEAPRAAAEIDPFGPKIYYFVIDKTDLLRNYKTNGPMLDALDKLLRDPDVYPRIDSVVVTSAASPIASPQHNARLSIGRSEALESYIRWKHPQVDRNRLYSAPIGIDWEGFWSLIENTQGVPSRDRIMKLRGPWSEEVTLQMLRSVGGADTYNYLLKTIYPKLQYASVRVVLNDGTSIPGAGSPLRRMVEPVVMYDTVYVERIIRDTVRIETPVEVPVMVAQEPAPQKKPFYIALKNNLVYDLALLPNLAVEIPFGRNYRWSAEVEGHWSWWNTDSSSWWYHRVQMAGVEMRYWFGKRSERDPMHGWYVGAYGYGGTYDLRMFTKDNPDLGQLSNKSWSAGLSIGYAMPVARRLSMEFGLGLGYFGGEYKKYYRSACGDDFPWVSTHNRNWFGPTKAKVSLVWQIGSGVNSKYMEKKQAKKQRKENE